MLPNNVQEGDKSKNAGCKAVAAEQMDGAIYLGLTRPASISLCLLPTCSALLLGDKGWKGLDLIPGCTLSIPATAACSKQKGEGDCSLCGTLRIGACSALTMNIITIETWQELC